MRINGSRTAIVASIKTASFPSLVYAFKIVVAQEEGRAAEKKIRLEAEFLRNTVSGCEKLMIQSVHQVPDHGIVSIYCAYIRWCENTTLCFIVALMGSGLTCSISIQIKYYANIYLVVFNYIYLIIALA